MKKADEGPFAVLITSLAAAFGKDPEPALVDAYFMALEDLKIHDVEAACKEAVRTCEFFPRPVQLRRLAGEPDTKTKALGAWHDMVTIRDGMHGTLIDTKDHPTDTIANKALALLGPMTLISDWEGPWAQKRFLENYEMLFDQERAQSRLDADRALSTGEARGLLPEGSDS